jgi:hypothetical protein
MKRKEHEAELRGLQAELCKLQDWVKYKGLRVIIVFEGRDAAAFAQLPNGSVLECSGSLHFPHLLTGKKARCISSVTCNISLRLAKS